jgi:hypothetical protein
MNYFKIVMDVFKNGEFETEETFFLSNENLDAPKAIDTAIKILENRAYKLFPNDFYSFSLNDIIELTQNSFEAVVNSNTGVSYINK